MLNFANMAGNYENRKVDRWDSKDEGKMVSTAEVSDGRKPYETAVKHPGYNKGHMVIVECYATKEEAQIGHDRWEDLIKKGALPTVLEDCGNSEVSQLCDMAGCDMSFEKGK